MNKKGVGIKNAFFAVVMVSLLVIAIGVLMDGFSDEYNIDNVYDLEDDYDRLDDLEGEAEYQEGQLTPEAAGGDEDFEATTFRGGFGVINSLFGSFGMVFGEGGMLDSLSERFGLGVYALRAIVILMVFSISAAIIAVIFRLARRSI